MAIVAAARTEAAIKNGNTPIKILSLDLVLKASPRIISKNCLAQLKMLGKVPLGNY